MDNQELRKLLEQLHAELEHTQTVDEKGRAMLRDLGDDIHWLLERSGEGHPQPQASMLARLESAIDYLEVTHPILTAALTALLSALSNAGI